MSVIINGSAGVTTNTGAVYDSLQRGTAVASTSGTSIDFTSIPSWVKRITVMFQGVGTNGTSIPQIQLGAGSITTSGYVGTAGIFTTTSAVSALSAGFLVSAGHAATVRYQGAATITSITGNTWACTTVLGRSDAANMCFCGGTIALSGTLDRVRITTVNGTDAFAAGTINIIYE